MLLHRGTQTGDFLLFGPGQAARLVMRFILVDQAPLSSERIPPPATPVTVIGGRGRENQDDFRPTSRALVEHHVTMEACCPFAHPDQPVMPLSLPRPQDFRTYADPIVPEDDLNAVGTVLDIYLHPACLRMLCDIEQRFFRDPHDLGRCGRVKRARLAAGGDEETGARNEPPLHAGSCDRRLERVGHRQ